jgi:hypothetical protein
MERDFPCNGTFRVHGWCWFIFQMASKKPGTGVLKGHTGSVAGSGKKELTGSGTLQTTVSRSLPFTFLKAFRYFPKDNPFP